MNNEIALKLMKVLEVIAYSIEDDDWANQVWRLLSEVKALIEADMEEVV
jgi:hypothetical protein